MKGDESEGEGATQRVQLYFAIEGLVGGRELPFLAEGIDPAGFADRCVTALEELGACSLDALYFLDEADAPTIERHLPELALPVHRRQFFALLYKRQRKTRKDDEMRQKAHAITPGDEGIHGPWLLGGLDERAKPPEPAPGCIKPAELRQIDGGLEWRGFIYRPYQPLTYSHHESCPPPAWLAAFETKLFDTLRKGEFFEVRSRLLLWRCMSAACPYPVLY
jgi:hypothetical protein